MRLNLILWSTANAMRKIADATLAIGPVGGASGIVPSMQHQLHIRNLKNKMGGSKERSNR